MPPNPPRPAPSTVAAVDPAPLPARAEALPLLRTEPALRWCLGGERDAPRVPDAALAGWWAAMAAARASFGHRLLLARDDDGELQGLAWVAPPPPDSAAPSAPEADAEAALTAQERAFERLLDTLDTLADEHAVGRYLTYAEAVDSLLPTAPCHSLSGVVAANARALAALVAQALAVVTAAEGSAGLLAECADPALADSFRAAGAAAAGEVWLPGLAVQAWWWPRAASASGATPP